MRLKFEAKCFSDLIFVFIFVIVVFVILGRQSGRQSSFGLLLNLLNLFRGLIDGFFSLFSYLLGNFFCFFCSCFKLFFGLLFSLFQFFSDHISSFSRGFLGLLFHVFELFFDVSAASSISAIFDSLNDVKSIIDELDFTSFGVISLVVEFIIHTVILIIIFFISPLFEFPEKVYKVFNSAPAAASGSSGVSSIVMSVSSVKRHFQVPSQEKSGVPM